MLWTETENTCLLPPDSVEGFLGETGCREAVFLLQMLCAITGNFQGRRRSSLGAQAPPSKVCGGQLCLQFRSRARARPPAPCSIPRVSLPSVLKGDPSSHPFTGTGASSSEALCLVSHTQRNFQNGSDSRNCLLNIAGG